MRCVADVSEIYLEVAEKKIKSLQNRAKKYDVGLSYTIEKSDVREVAEDYYLQFYKITCEYENFGVDGFQVIGMVESVTGSDRNLVYDFTEDKHDLSHYVTSKVVCEHCNINRYRKYALILLNQSTGEIKQVGKACAKDYSGSDRIIGILDFYDSISRFMAETNEMEFDADSQDSIKKALKYSMYKVEHVVTIAEQVIAKTGHYISYDTSVMLMKASTKNLVCSRLNGIALKKLVVSDSAKEAIQWIRDCDGDSTFIQNLKTVASKEYASLKEVGFLCYLPVSYKNHLEYLERQRQIELEGQIQFFDGYKDEVGDKVETKAKLIRTAGYDSMYGYVNIYTFKGENDICYVWKTTSNIIAEKGSECILKGKVKALDEYNNIKQTVLTRCKVTV